MSSFQYILTLLCVLLQVEAATGQVTVSGVVKDKITGEPLMGAHVYDARKLSGTSTDENGFYQFTISTDTLELKASYIGYFSKTVIELTSNSEDKFSYDFFLEPNIQELSGIEVTAFKSAYDILEKTRNRYEEVNDDLNYESEIFYRVLTEVDEIPSELTEVIYTFSYSHESRWNFNQGRIARNFNPRKPLYYQYINVVDLQQSISLFQPILNIPGPLDRDWRKNYHFEIANHEYIDSLEVYRITFSPRYKEARFNGWLDIETNNYQLVGGYIEAEKIANPEVIEVVNQSFENAEFQYYDTSLKYSFKCSPIQQSLSHNVYWLPYHSDLLISTHVKAELELTLEYMLAHDLDKDELKYQSKVTTKSSSNTFKYMFQDYMATKNDGLPIANIYENKISANYNRDKWKNLSNFGIQPVDEKVRQHFLKNGAIPYKAISKRD